MDLDGLDVLGVLRPRPRPGRALGPGDVRAALDRPMDSPPLAELARGARTAAVLVSGKDRITRADVFMPPLVETLRAAGVAARDVTVFIATGTHVRFRPEDRPVVVGRDLHPEIRVVGHDCMDGSTHVELGTTSFGNRVAVNRDAYERDVKVLTGRITHHYFAGFTAGRKAVLPGVSAFDTIRYNHEMVLSGFDGQARHPEVRNGSLEENPVHLDMVEAARMFEPTFVLNTVVDTDHQVAGIFAGDLLRAHAEGCALVADSFEVEIDRRADLAVASCGGAPYDCSFMQALKTLMNMHACVRDGGTFVLLAECPEGIKPEFLRWEHGVPLPQFARRVHADYDLTGHNTYLLREIAQRIDVVLVSGCPTEQVERLGLRPAGTVEEGLAWGRRTSGTPDPTAYVIPFGNVTVLRGT